MKSLNPKALPVKVSVTASDGAAPKLTPRSKELLRRAGIDPLRADSRPLAEIMQDHIPYGRWNLEAYLRQRR